MEQQTRRERKKEVTRNRLLEIAFKLFSQQGFYNTTVDQITEEADIGKGTFYNYFSSKEAVLNDFMEYISRERGEKIWPAVMALQDTRQRLAKGFQSVTSWFEEYPEVVRVYMMYRVNAGMGNLSQFKLSHFELFMAEILKKGQELGDIRDDIDAMELVMYLNGVFLMKLCQWFESGSPPGLQDMVMHAVDFFLIGALSTEIE